MKTQYKTPKERREYQRLYNLANKEKIKEYQRQYNLLRRKGITLPDKTQVVNVVKAKGKHVSRYKLQHYEVEKFTVAIGRILVGIDKYIL